MRQRLFHWLAKKFYHNGLPTVLSCPHCQAHILRPSLQNLVCDMIATCRHCGWYGALDTFLQHRSGPDETIAQPHESRVEVVKHPDGERSWILPARKKINLVIVFALIFLSFTAAISLTGLLSENETESAGWMLYLVPFWIVDIGLLTVGLWIALCSQTLTLRADRVLVSTRRFLGLSLQKKIDVSTDPHVEQVEAYQKNHEPVYTVEITGRNQDRIRLMTTISEEEQSWMIGQLKEALGLIPPRSLEPKVAESARWTPGFEESPRLQDLAEFHNPALSIRRLGPRGFTMALRFPTSLLLGILGVFFLGVGIFLVRDTLHDWHPPDEGLFGLFDIAFTVLPLVMSAVFLLGAVVMLYLTLEGRTKVRTFHFEEDQLIVEPEWPVGASGGRFHREAFTHVDHAPVGNVNGSPRYAIKLIGPANVVVLCRFRPAEESEALAEWARAWLR